MQTDNETIMILRRDLMSPQINEVEIGMKLSYFIN